MQHYMFPDSKDLGLDILGVRPIYHNKPIKENDFILKC